MNYRVLRDDVWDDSIPTKLVWSDSTKITKGAKLMRTMLKPLIWPSLIFCLCLTARASAAGDVIGLITKPSRYSVAETIDRFEAAVKGVAGFQVIARIDFQTLAVTPGGKVRHNQLLIFDRGTILPPLLSDIPAIAIDLPLKALAWEDESGKVWLSNNTGEFLRERHGVKAKDDMLKRLTDVTESFASKVLE